MVIDGPISLKNDLGMVSGIEYILVDDIQPAEALEGL
jgi:hypothetical protein